MDEVGRLAANPVVTPRAAHETSAARRNARCGRLRARPMIAPRPYGPEIARSTWSASFSATAAARATVIDPPPPGTVADPEELAVALSTVTEREPPAQEAAIPPTVTLTTLEPERFCVTVTPSESQREIKTLPAPSAFDDEPR